jgi:hypothetical protein
MNRSWKSHFIYSTQCIKTTWTLRLILLVCVVLIVWLGRPFWAPAVAQSLVCDEQIVPADAILVENFDPDYLLFERAEALYKAGLASKVFVPTDASADGKESQVSAGIVEVMSRVAWLEKRETIPVRGIEPISLNAAYQILAVLEKQHVRSVLVVTPGFRSRRSSLVYTAVLGRTGIAVSCVPVFGTKTLATWATTLHGVQEVAEQFIKLQYYRWYVLPVYGSKERSGAPAAVSVRREAGLEQ